jgi:cysteine desulfurase family protein (TIGR01976 family)
VTGSGRATRPDPAATTAAESGSASGRTPSQESAAVADPDRIRALFPALRREVGGQAVAYFDGPGGTQVPDTVADAVRDYLLERNANSGWNYPTSRETDEVLRLGRAAFADFFGGRPDEIAFGANMTTLTLRISRALGRSLRPGDPVVVTELDHHANVDPWLALAAERGAEIRVARMDPGTGTLDMDDLHNRLRGAKVLAIGAASNALGTIPDVAAAARWAREEGATVFVDAVHYAPHQLLDVTGLGADFVVVSPYKFYGPHLGVLWGRRERIEALELPRVASAPDHAPDRIETGTLSFEAIAGATAAVDFLAELGRASSDEPRRDRLRRAFHALHAAADPLFRRLWDGTASIPGVRTFGPEPDRPRTPTLAFAIDRVDPAAAAGRLADSGIFLSHGDFYATTVVRRLGLQGSGLLRAGCVAYTTAADVDRLLAGVADLARLEAAGR